MFTIGERVVMVELGSTIPFRATKAQREASGDPRPSIEERYSSKEDYLGRVRRAAQGLVDEGYLLAEDLQFVIGQASQQYDAFCGTAEKTQAAAD